MRRYLLLVGCVSRFLVADDGGEIVAPVVLAPQELPVEVAVLPEIPIQQVIADAQSGALSQPALVMPGQGNQIKFSGDFLYWIGGVAGLDEVEEIIVPPSATGDTTLHRHIYPFPFDWGCGFRVGMAYEFSDRWELESSWTRFYQTSQDRHHGDPNEFDLPTYHKLLNLAYADDAADVGQLLRIKTSFRLRFDEIDVGFATNAKINDFFSLQPAFGYRYLNLRQKFHLTEVAHESAFGTAIYSFKNEFMGSGLFAALGTSWVLGKGFSFFGGGSSAFTWGAYHRHRSSRVTPESAIVTDPDNVGFKVKSVRRKDTIIPEFSLRAGINWRGEFDWAVKSLDIRLGYEFRCLIDAFRIWQRGTNSFSSIGMWNNQYYNVYFHGATAGMEIAF